MNFISLKLFYIVSVCYDQGGWPKNFLPENIVFENHWFPRLEGKIIVYELQKELGKSMENIFYKVVKKTDETSVFASGKYQIKYRDGKTVKAPENTFGMMLFDTIEHAEKFIKSIDHTISQNDLKIKQVRASSAEKLSRRVAYLTTAMLGYIETHLSDFYDYIGAELELRDEFTIKPPEGTFVCFNGVVVGDVE